MSEYPNPPDPTGEGMPPPAVPPGAEQPGAERPGPERPGAARQAPATGGRKASRPPWLGGCLILSGVAALFFIFLMVLMSIGGRGGGIPGRGGAQFSSHRVGLIDLEGEIFDSRGFLEELERLENDGRVRALVVRIDSPGGAVAPTQEMHEALLDYRAETGHPVVASLGSLAASGGYYVACAADRIVVEPGSLTGSIGVIFAFTDASELMRKIGLRTEVVKSGTKKDFGAYWRSLTDEERDMLDGIIADVYDQFTEAVSAGRNLPLDQVRILADGRILTGRQAVSAGLADTLGYRRDAVEIAAEMGGMSPETPVETKRRFDSDWFEILRKLTSRVNALSEGRPQLLYR